MGVVVEDSLVAFALADPGRRLRGVRLRVELDLGARLRLRYSEGFWRLELPFPLPAGGELVDRLEYLFEVEDHNGHRQTITDPDNPRRVGGAFGDKSELVLPGYAEPEWLDWPEAAAVESPIHLPPVRPGRAGIDGSLWSPESLAANAASGGPLLVVNDGPEYASIGMFRRYLAAGTGTEGTLPPVRALLLSPGDRNVNYSANSTYADNLSQGLRSVNGLRSGECIGLGVSLGALAQLHAHWSDPSLYDALFLQSGSFFTGATDAQERRFKGFRAVSSFVESVHGAERAERPIPVVLTCGSAEENFVNNHLMAESLGRLGYPVELVEVRDAHNYTGWRDALHPHLTALVARVSENLAA